MNAGAVPAPERRGDRPRGGNVPVLVVGAGPVGLSAALALRAAGLPVTLLEAQSEARARPGSRAIFVHRESLLLLERARPGLGYAIAARGLVWSTKRTFWRGRQVYERTYPPADPSVLPHATNLSQVEIERLLLDACLAADVDVRYDSEVVSLTGGDEHVELATATGARWEASFVLAADGARSAVRRLLGIELSGSRSENAFVIVDVAEDVARPRPAERIFHYHHPAVGGRHVLQVPFAGHWRVDLQCRIDDDPDDFAGDVGARRWIDAVMPSGYSERIAWVSTYRFLQSVADRFTDDSRRVVLLGEAAHLFAPFGARGMNSGIADAVAAARAIQRSAAATTAERVATVDDFAGTRRDAALYNRQAAAQALRHLQGTDLSVRATRAAAAVVARLGQRAGGWLDAAPYGPRARAASHTSGTY